MDALWRPAYVAIGSNLNHPRERGLEACERIRALPAALLGIEREMGRIRGERWGPRLIDLDLVWMVGPPIEELGFTLPHPGVSTRNFVLYPLDDIAPALDIPGHGRVRELKLRS